jgi:hypothetical protein
MLRSPVMPFDDEQVASSNLLWLSMDICPRLKATLGCCSPNVFLALLNAVNKFRNDSRSGVDLGKGGRGSLRVFFIPPRSKGWLAGGEEKLAGGICFSNIFTSSFVVLRCNVVVVVLNLVLSEQLADVDSLGTSHPGRDSVSVPVDDRT